MSMKLKKTSNSYLKTHMSSQRFLKLNSMEDFSVSNNTTHRIKPKSQNRKKKSMNRMDEASHRNKIDTETISSHNKHRRLIITRAKSAFLLNIWNFHWHCYITHQNTQSLTEVQWTKWKEMKMKTQSQGPSRSMSVSQNVGAKGEEKENVEAREKKRGRGGNLNLFFFLLFII